MGNQSKAGLKMEEGLEEVLEGAQMEFPDATTIHGYFDTIVEDQEFLKSKTALIDHATDTELTFEQVSRLSSQLSQVLKTEIESAGPNNNPDGDVVIAVCLKPSERLITCLFGILKVGAAYVPLEPSFPENRIKLILETAKPMLLIADFAGSKCLESKLEGLAGAGVKVLSLDELWTRAEELEADVGPSCSTVGAEDTAIVLFTSGSSGTPKGVRISHRNVFNRLNWNWQEWPLDSTEVCCSKTSLTFVDSLPEIFGTLLQGATLVVFPKEVTSQPHLFLKALEDRQISRVILVPSFLRSLLTVLKLEGGEKKLRRLKKVISSGETLGVDVAKAFFEAFPEGDTMLCNVYGSTEMGDVCYEAFDGAESVSSKCSTFGGQQVPLGSEICYNTEIYVLGNDLKPVAKNQMGEIFSAGLNVAKGYVGVQDSEKFLPNHLSKSAGYNSLYRTGDFGAIHTLPNGRKTLLYHGRFDSQIKIRGHRVDLQEVEEILRHCSEIAQLVVLCCRPGQEGQAVVAFLQLKKLETDIKQVQNFAVSHLLSYQVPKLFPLDEFPYLVNGKIDRQKLLEMYENSVKEGVFDWSTTSVTEKCKTLLQVTSTVTSTPVQTLLDNMNKSFFDLGGTSLNSLTVVAKLRDAGYSIGIEQFISAESIAAVVEVLELVSDTPAALVLESTGVSEQYKTEVMTQKHKNQVIHLFSSTFTTSGDLERWLPGATYDEYVKWMETIWDEVVAAPYSYVVVRKSTNEMVAAAINYDEDEEPKNTHGGNKALETVCEFILAYEDPLRHLLPQGKLLQNFMTGVVMHLNPGEKVILMQYMEQENIKIGKAYDFVAMTTTNTNLLTQEIGRNHPGYVILGEAQLNTWVNSEGQRPFAEAPDSQTIQMCYIDLSKCP